MNAPLKARERAVLELHDEDIAAYRKLEPAQRLKMIRGQRAERVFTVERDAIDKEARTAWLSIASDAPYERWWGVEVLDMKKESIRDERLRMGAPLLVGHDTADLVGVVERHEITLDKKLRILARFGKSARAEEVWQDVLDGIRRNASVGYVIHDLLLEKQEEDVSTYRVTDWEPLEGSLVAVPADPSVGVGRGIDPDPQSDEYRRSDMDPKEQARIDAEAKARLEAEVKAKADADAKALREASDRAAADALTREQARVNGILAAGDVYADLGGPALARTLIADRANTIDTFKAQMLEKLRGRSQPTNTVQGADREAHYGQAARVHYSHGALRAFRDLPIKGGGTMKAEECAYRAGMWMAAQIYKKDWALRKCKDLGIGFHYRDEVSGEVRVMTENVLGQGGALVPIEMEVAIISLRDTYGVARRLARVRPMASDTLQIPRRKGGITAYFFQDDDAVGLLSSDKAWDMVGLHTKKVGALAKISRDLVEDAVISVVDDMAQEQAYAFAKLEDNALIVGDGTSTYGGIVGVNTKFLATAYVSRIAAASGHHVFTTVDNVDLTNLMAGVSQYAIGPGAVFLTSAAGKATMFNRLKAIAGGNRIDTLGQMPQDDYLGYPIITSEAMPAGPATDYTSKVMALYGRFDLAASFGSRRGIEVQVLQERFAELGLIGVISTERIDIVVHDLGDAASVKGAVSALYGTA